MRLVWGNTEVEMLAFYTLVNLPSHQLPPSEHNVGLSLPFLISHFFHPFVLSPSGSLSTVHAFNYTEGGRDEGLEEVLGSRRNGFTPLIHRR